MERLKLVIPTEEHESQVMKFLSEIQERNEYIAGFNGLEIVSSYADWIMLNKLILKTTIPVDVYLAVRINDDKVVGIIDARHYLSESLLNFNGNIGFSIRPAYRENGYATEMLGLVLEKCREYGEEKVLITCAKGNIASAKTIIKNGGILENEVEDTVGLVKSGEKIIQRYWINL